jgi:hypothetical protein
MGFKTIEKQVERLEHAKKPKKFKVVPKVPSAVRIIEKARK